MATEQDALRLAQRAQKALDRGWGPAEDPTAIALVSIALSLASLAQTQADANGTR